MFLSDDSVGKKLRYQVAKGCWACFFVAGCVHPLDSPPRVLLLTSNVSLLQFTAWR